MPRPLRFVAPTLIFVVMGLWILSVWLPDWTEADEDDVVASSALVEEHGFTIKLDGVTISAEASVAPIGTSVEARLVDHYMPEAFAGFADPVGQGVEVILG